MNSHKSVTHWLQDGQLNFWLTNGLPRRSLTRFVGWLSRLEQRPIPAVSMAIWKAFADLDLSEAREQNFKSLHACFTRELKPGARTVEPDPQKLSSPCDAIVGACGNVEGTRVFQAKGQPYALDELLLDSELAEHYRDGCYVTLRLTSSMYHRFHAPHDCTVNEVHHVSGDTWNVNPPTLQRVSKLYCRNERAVIRTTLARGAHAITLVPVAAVLVASIRLHFLDVLLHMGYKGAKRMACKATITKGQEMGWFEHGSTIIVFAPRGFALAPGIRDGQTIRMGQALMCLPEPSASEA